MKNHIDMLIFHTAICAGASQICPDGRCKSDICIAPSRKRSGMEIKMEIWKKLYDEAKAKLSPRVISPFIEAGGVAAAILTDKGNIYTGVCIDTSCTLGMCAERNAIANMITNGESKIVKLVCVMGDGRVGSPCGACREYLMQLDKDSPKMEILRDYETMSVITLEELIPDWWGKEEMR